MQFIAAQNTNFFSTQNELTDSGKLPTILQLTNSYVTIFISDIFPEIVLYGYEGQKYLFCNLQYLCDAKSNYFETSEYVNLAHNHWT